ncbi:MAG: hypothetical protein C5B52_03225 [Bacteroidetes bacterium]|nr:MAG: hypothetical protein C5B52_03225 [Bacteroidota bacterium]
MKFALLTVTYAGLFYDGKALAIEEQILKAKELGFDGLSIETKRPVAAPFDIEKSRRAKIRDMAAGEGIELCAIESMSNFVSEIMEERENNLAMMKQVLEFAKDLNVNLVKIFAAWPGIVWDKGQIASYAPYDRGNYFKYLSSADLVKWHQAMDGIREVADWAADLGITLALQNHAPVISPGYEDVLAMMHELDRKNIKLCLDVPLYADRQKDKYVLESVRACGKHIVLTHYGAWNFSETSAGEVVQEPAPFFGGQINYETFIPALQQIGYEGYLVSEYCLPVVRNHKITGIEEVDRATRRGLKYMKQLVNSSISIPA